MSFTKKISIWHMTSASPRKMERRHARPDPPCGTGLLAVDSCLSMIWSRERAMIAPIHPI